MKKIFLAIIILILSYNCFCSTKVVIKIPEINDLLKSVIGNTSDSATTWFFENIDGNFSVFGCKVYYVQLHVKNNIVDYISVIFANKGDNVNADKSKIFAYMTEKAKVKKNIIRENEILFNEMKKIFGKPGKAIFSQGKIEEKVNLWVDGEYAYILSFQKDDYVGIKIVSKNLLKKKGTVKLYIDNDISLLKLKKNVEEKNNGDVLIQNIPMIDQGTKGYCTPAIWTRYLNYLGFYIDMYALAQKGTDAGDGTLPIQMKYTVNSILTQYRMNAVLLNSFVPKISFIEPYINKGLPLVWHVDLPQGGHTRLIIGYNKRLGKIAFTDSWGKGFEEEWMTEKEALKISAHEQLEVVNL